MKLLLVLTVGALAVLGACGDNDGPAADVGGVWNGQMASTNPAAPGGGHFGAICIEIDQDGRDLAGRVVFEAEGEHSIGGRIANDTLSFVWNSNVTATNPPPSVSFGSGGNFTGSFGMLLPELTTATGPLDSLSGTWVSVSGDSGNWTVTRGTAESCG